MSISVKSLGTLFDELITTNIKCYMAQEIIMAKHLTDVPDVIAKAAKDAQELNARRSQLIRAIDERMGESDITQTAKSYE